MPVALDYLSPQVAATDLAARRATTRRTARRQGLRLLRWHAKLFHLIALTTVALCVAAVLTLTFIAAFATEWLATLASTLHPSRRPITRATLTLAHLLVGVIVTLPRATRRFRRWSPLCLPRA